VKHEFHSPKEHERKEEKKAIRAFAAIFSDLQEHEWKGLDEGGYKLEPFIAWSNVVRPMHTPLKKDFFCLRCLPFRTFYHARLAVDHTLVYRFLLSFILFPLITTVGGLTFACLTWHSSSLDRLNLNASCLIPRVP
jgi:hypothetical protein